MNKTLVVLAAAFFTLPAWAADLPRYRVAPPVVVAPPPVVVAPPPVVVDPDDLEIAPPSIIVQPPVVTVDPDDIEEDDDPDVEVYVPPVRVTPYGGILPKVRFYRHRRGFHHYGWRHR